MATSVRSAPSSTGWTVVTVDNIARELGLLRKVVYGLTAGIIVVAVGMTLLAQHVLDRQHIADTRAERQRAGLCKVLSTLPGRHVLPGIDGMRRTWARPDHPRDCYPRPKATPTPSNAKAGSSPGAQPTVVVVQPQPSHRPAASPAPSHTASPRPHPTDTPTSSPPPEPKPKPTPCHLLRHPLHCL